MRCRIKGAVWTYQCAGTDADGTGVEEGAIEVYIDSFANTRGENH